MITWYPGHGKLPAPAAGPAVAPAHDLPSVFTAAQGPDQRAVIMQVSSTETGAIFGNIVYEGTGAMDRQVTAMPHAAELMPYWHCLWPAFLSFAVVQPDPAEQQVQL
jgi:hypothetical protein